LGYRYNIRRPPQRPAARFLPLPAVHIKSKAYYVSKVGTPEIYSCGLSSDLKSRDFESSQNTEIF
jgi:hypothetical protein